jgi:DNA polymerase III sliding clamp (beta) subunit (PCNA family)
LFTSSTKPVVIRPMAGPSGGDTIDYTYLIMPVRLPG